MATAAKHYHAVQFYKDEKSLATTVARFLAEGINAGHPAVVIATPSHSASITRKLDGLGLDVQALRRRADIHMMDADDLLSTFMVGELPDPLLFKSNLGNVIEQLCEGRAPCPIRAYGEMVDILWQKGNGDGAIKLEILWNQLASTYEFELLCGYAFGHFYKETSDSRFQSVCDQHTVVLPNV
jgi:hypothetical protein